MLNYCQLLLVEKTFFLQVESLLAALSVKLDSNQERLIACEVPPLKLFFFCMAGGILALSELLNRKQKHCFMLYCTPVFL